MPNKKIDSVELYLKEVRDALMCPELERKKFRRDFSENVCTYVSDNPTAQKHDLYARFGSPEEIGESFAYAEDRSVVQKSLNSRKRQRFFLRILVVLAAVAVLLLGLFVIDTCLYNHGESFRESPVEGTPPPPNKIIWDVY